MYIHAWIFTYFISILNGFNKPETLHMINPTMIHSFSGTEGRAWDPSPTDLHLFGGAFIVLTLSGLKIFPNSTNIGLDQIGCVCSGWLQLALEEERNNGTVLDCATWSHLEKREEWKREGERNRGGRDRGLGQRDS